MQEIFTRYADGEPAEKLAASLNERGLRTRTGKPFVKNRFFQIFRNRRYIGEYRYKDIVTPGCSPAIVDQYLFDRVQQRFEQNRIDVYKRQELDGAIIMGTGFQPKALVQFAKTLCRVLAVFHGWQYRSKFVACLLYTSRCV